MKVKEIIDALPARELQEFKKEADPLSHNEQMEAAGRFLARHWVLRWNSTDSTYLLYKAGVKIKML